MKNQIKTLVASFGQTDPRAGCWPWIIKNHSQLWQDHQAAIRDSNLPKMAATFKAMLAAWNDRQTVRPGLEGML